MEIAESQLSQPPFHVDVFGRGTPLVMLHGWAMHSGLWLSFAKELSQRHRVFLIDLPGHGFSQSFNLSSELSELADQLVTFIKNEIKEPAQIFGWSFGGLVALQTALIGSHWVKSLMLAATSPCFVRRADWQEAVAKEVFISFADDLNNHYQQTLIRFLSLQCRGSDQSRDNMRNLRKSFTTRSKPEMSAIQNGLNILLETDLREQALHLNVPFCVIAGERDTLVPPEVAKKFWAKISLAKVNMIKGAGHAPFISHALQCKAIIDEFLNESE